jgi:hypothetical protein
VKTKLALALTLGLMLTAGLAASADGFVWHLRYGQAKNAAKEEARRTCNRVRGCEAYGVGQCYRRAASRYDCSVGYWFPGTEGPEENICTVILHVGVSYNGYVQIKNSGPPRC